MGQTGYDDLLARHTRKRRTNSQARRHNARRGNWRCSAAMRSVRLNTSKSFYEVLFLVRKRTIAGGNIPHSSKLSASFLLPGKTYLSGKSLALVGCPFSAKLVDLKKGLVKFHQVAYLIWKSQSLHGRVGHRPPRFCISCKISANSFIPISKLWIPTSNLRN